MHFREFRSLLTSGLLVALTGCIVVGSEGEISFESSSGYTNGESVAAECDPSGTPFGGGTGTAGDPYTICNASQFVNIQTSSNSNFILASGIDLGTIAYMPLASFYGTLDGNFYQIWNLGYSGSDTTGGLFSSMSGTVKNLYLSGSLSLLDIPGTAQRWGGIAGSNSGMIDNVNVSVTVYTDSPDTVDYMGGIAGINTGTIQNSWVYANTTASGTTYAHFGGVAGINTGTISTITASAYLDTYANPSSTEHGGIVAYNQSTGSIQSIYVSGNLTGRSIIGGVVGFNSGQIHGSMSDVSVSGSGSAVGGFVGENSGPNAVITNSSVNSGTVTNTSATGLATGGFAGRLNANGLIDGCSSYASVTNAGGRTGGFAGEMLGGNTRIYNSDAFGNVSVTLNSQFAGGFIGFMSVASMSEVYRVSATGNVSGYDGVGGLIGTLQGPSTGAHNVRESFATGSVSALANAGGLIGHGVNARIIASYSSGTVWAMDFTPATAAYFGGIVGKLDGESRIEHSYSRSMLVNQSNDPENRLGGLVGITNFGSGTPVLLNNYFSGSLVNGSLAASPPPNTYDVAIQNRYPGTTLDEFYYDMNNYGGLSVHPEAIGCSMAMMTSGGCLSGGFGQGSNETAPWVIPGSGYPYFYWE